MVHNHNGTPSCNYPKEDVFGRIKSGCIDASGVGRGAFADNSAGKTRDGTLRDKSLFTLLTPCYCISHHKVYGTLSRTPNLQKQHKNNN